MAGKGWCRCEVSVLGPKMGRRGNALAYDTGEAGVQKAWTASQRPLVHLEMCLMLPIARGTKCCSLSLWLQCPWVHLHEGQDTHGPEACSSHLHKG